MLHLMLKLPTFNSDKEEISSVDHPLGAARAQVHETYIVSQSEDGIVIVDQHAAHERLVYERMKKALEVGGVLSQGLLIPEVIEVSDVNCYPANRARWKNSLN